MAIALNFRSSSLGSSLAWDQLPLCSWPEAREVNVYVNR